MAKNKSIRYKWDSDKSFKYTKGSLQKKISKKSDIVTIRSGTYLPYLNSDIKFSGSKTFYLPTPRK